MFTENFDIRRSAWDGSALAAVLERLADNGYQGFTAEFRDLVGHFARAGADVGLPAVVSRADEFADVLVPPAQPYARIILHRRTPDVLRVVVVGRSQHEARLAGTALKVHLEAVVGRLDELIADERGRSHLTRFRRDVVPALHLGGDGERAPEIRSVLAAQLLRALRHRPVVRGRPTVLVSQLSALLPDRPAEQVREVLEQLVGERAIERWHTVLCRESGQWLGSSSSAEEMRTFLSLAMDCPHCGRRVSEEQADVAYRLGESAQTYLDGNRWMCDLIETALRRMGVEAVAVQPGAGDVDGAACYQDSLILFRATDDPVNPGDMMRLQEQGRRLEDEGWRVFPLLVTDRPIGLDAADGAVTVVEGMSALDHALERILRAAREAGLFALLPAVLRPAGVPIIELLPAE